MSYRDSEPSAATGSRLLKKRFSIGRFQSVSQSQQSKESFLSKLNPLGLTQLLPEESSAQLCSAEETSAYTSPAETISSQCSPGDITNGPEEDPANFFYLSPSNLTFPPSQESLGEDSKSLFPELRDEGHQNPVLPQSIGGLFDKVIYGSAINFSKNKPPQPPSDKCSQQKENAPNRVFALIPEAEVIITKTLDRLNMGMNTVLTDCLVLYEASPYTTALFLSNKIRKMLNSKPSIPDSAPAKIPCVGHVIAALENIFSYSGPHLGNMQFPISCASVICTVFILDIYKICTENCPKIDASLNKAMKKALFAAYAKLVISTDSPLFSKREANWLLSSAKEERPINEPQLVTRDLTKVLKETYFQCSFGILAEILSEYPDSESDLENDAIISPPPKKAKQVDFKENKENSCESMVAPYDPKATLKEFLSAPKIVVTSRTDAKGILGRKLVPAPSPIKLNSHNPGNPKKRTHLGDMANTFQSPEKLQGIVIPSTPLSDM